jgi:hypothetical protein
MKFEIGDKVRIIVSGNCVPEINGGLGMIGTVVKELDRYDESLDDYLVESATFTIGKCWCFKEDKLELVGEPSVPVFDISIGQCPRCGGEMMEKQSEYCGIINKCRSCGWC